MDLVGLWTEKLEAGEIRFDPDLLVIRRDGSSAGEWGTVYYSEARERYKTEVKRRSNTSFDLELMQRMFLADHGSLIIAANPNSLFPGHLVIYPRQKSDRLLRENFADVMSLAVEHPNVTFIHNGERSAASIVDWAHFQAYAMDFPLLSEELSEIGSSADLSIETTRESFPAYALKVQGNRELACDFLSKIDQELSKSENPHAERIPVNYIWSGETSWIVPRAKGQSDIASRFFGGLEIGGLFCLPNAAEFPAYLPSSLDNTVRESTLRCAAESDTREWFEGVCQRLL